MTWIVTSLVISLFVVTWFSQRSWRIFSSILGLHVCLIIVWFALDGVSDSGFDESVIYHMSTGLSGAGLAGYESYVLAWSAALVLAIAAIYFGSTKISLRPRSFIVRFLLIFFPLSLFYINPLIVDIRHQSVLLASLFYAETGGDKGTRSLGPLQALYVVPPKFSAQADSKNIVLIYLEGLERNYLDRSTFGDLLPNLRALSHDAIKFDNITMPTFTDWTIGAMVGSQCGLPLVPLGNAGRNELRGYKSFLPGAICMGDLLNTQGYTTEFIGGASLSFAGKGDFLASHGFQTSWGADELQGVMPRKTPRNVWGFNDDAVFRFGKQRYDALSRNESPFFLNMLTVGTHPPKGYLSPECETNSVLQHDEPMLDAVRCTDFVVSRLIRYILDQDVDHKTLVVLFSDHLAHPNSQSENLEKRVPRKLLFWIFDKQAAESAINIAGPGTTFDVAPTVLAMAGMNTDGLGFGRNLLTYGTSELITDQLLTENAVAISQYFWQPPNIKSSFYLKGDQSELTWGEKKYSLPLVIQFKRDLSVDAFYWSTPLDSLMSKFQVPGSVMIDSCEWVSLEESTRWCLYYRNFSNEVSFEPWDGDAKQGGEVAAVLAGEQRLRGWEPDKGYLLVSSSGPKLFSGLIVNGEDRPFKRGLNVVQVAADGARVVANLDLCKQPVRAEDVKKITRLVESREADTYLAVKGTLGCRRNSQEKLLASLVAEKLGQLGPRQPYIGKFSRSIEAASERTAQKGGRVHYSITGYQG